MSDDSEIIAELTVAQSVLQQYVDTLTPIVDEAKLHISAEGVTARVVDPANVASILPADLHAEACEYVDAPGQATVGVNLGRLDDLIGAANSGDLIRLRLDMATRKLLIDYREIHHEMALIDPDSIRGEPDDPGLELPNSVVVEGGDLAEAVDVVELSSDHLRITAPEDGDSVELLGEGDIDVSRYVFDADTLITNGLREATESLFSLEYVSELVKPIPSDAEVAITFGEEFPMELEWSACEGGIEVKQLLAPRIQSK